MTDYIYDNIDFVENGNLIIGKIPSFFYEEECLKEVLNREIYIQLEALYKQAIYGPCNIPKPPFYEVVENASWRAWSALHNKSRDMAAIEYTEKCTELFNNIVQKSKELNETMSVEERNGAFEILSAMKEYTEIEKTKGNESSESQPSMSVLKERTLKMVSSESENDDFSYEDDIDTLQSFTESPNIPSQLSNKKRPLKFSQIEFIRKSSDLRLEEAISMTTATLRRLESLETFIQSVTKEHKSLNQLREEMRQKESHQHTRILLVLAASAPFVAYTLWNVWRSHRSRH